MGPHSASHLRALAMGEDPREIQLDIREKTLSREHTYLTDENPGLRWRTPWLSWWKM